MENSTSVPLPFKFSEFCTMCDMIAGLDGNAKLKPLEKMWATLKEISDKGLKNAPPPAPGRTPVNAGDYFFPVMRLLIPTADTFRSTYGLKESKIASYYIDLIGIPVGSPDYTRLKYWKDPGKNAQETTSFSDIIYTQLIKRGWEKGGTFTVTEINDKLDDLSKAQNVGEKHTVLMSLLRNTSATEQKWLIRIIMKEMKMKLNQDKVFSHFHQDARELFNNMSDLYEVCKRCMDPSEIAGRQLGDISTGIFMFKPMKPMLASVVDSARLRVLLKDEKMLLEPKYDGERFMIHISNGKSGGADPNAAPASTTGGKISDGWKIQYWSRNIKNFSEMYGPKFNDVLVKQLRGVNNCILDGEFLLFDHSKQKFVEFGHNRTFATAEGTGITHEVDGVKMSFCYAIFDIVFLNGLPLTSESLSYRKVILNKHIAPVHPHIEIVPSTPCTSIPGILQALDTALTNKYEGVMIKIAGSNYQPGERKLKWMKLKPDHISGMSDTVDLIILGAYYGTKFGQRRLSHFLLGCWDNRPLPGASNSSAQQESYAGELVVRDAFPENEADGRDAKNILERTSSQIRSPNAKFITVTKVGSGYNDQELEEINARLESHWLTLPPGTVPPWIPSWKPEASDRPDVYVNPKDSLVMEVVGFSFNETTKFSFGHTMRFPRCTRMRHDKGVEDANHLVHLRNIQKNSGHFAKKAEALEDFVTIKAEKLLRRKNDKKMKAEFKSTRPERTFAKVQDRVGVVTSKEVELQSNLFDGYEICVLFASAAEEAGLGKTDIEALCAQHGASPVSNPGRMTSIILATTSKAQPVQNWINQCNSQDPKAKALMEKYQTKSIISVRWLKECIAAKTVLPLAPKHVIYADAALLNSFQMTLDQFNDSYYEAATMETLKDSIHQARVRGRQPRSVFADTQLSINHGTDNSTTTTTGGIDGQPQPQVVQVPALAAHERLKALLTLLEADESEDEVPRRSSSSNETGGKTVHVREPVGDLEEESGRAAKRRRLQPRLDQLDEARKRSGVDGVLEEHRTNPRRVSTLEAVPFDLRDLIEVETKKVQEHNRSKGVPTKVPTVNPGAQKTLFGLFDSSARLEGEEALLEQEGDEEPLKLSESFLRELEEELDDGRQQEQESAVKRWEYSLDQGTQSQLLGLDRKTLSNAQQLTVLKVVAKNRLDSSIMIPSFGPSLAPIPPSDRLTHQTLTHGGVPTDEPARCLMKIHRETTHIIDTNGRAFYVKSSHQQLKKDKEKGVSQKKQRRIQVLEDLAEVDV